MNKFKQIPHPAYRRDLFWVNNPTIPNTKPKKGITPKNRDGKVSVSSISVAFKAAMDIKPKTKEMNPVRVGSTLFL